jgi:hypothetical protein
MADRVILRDLDADRNRYSAEFHASSVRLIWEDLTPGDRGHNDLLIPNEAIAALVRLWLMERNADGDDLKRAVLDALEDLSYHRDQDIERERTRIYLVERQAQHEAAVAERREKSREADELYAVFKRALVFIPEER